MPSQYPRITAWAVVYKPGTTACSHTIYPSAAAAADRAACMPGAAVRKLVEEAPLLQKFDGYVPADTAAELRWRIIELEAVVRDLQGQAYDSHDACVPFEAAVSRMFLAPLRTRLQRTRKS